MAVNTLIEQLKQNVRFIQQGLGIIETDQQGTIIKVNEVVADLLMFRPEQMQGNPVEQFIEDFPKALPWQGVLTLVGRSGTKVKVPAILSQSDDGRKWVKIIPVDLSQYTLTEVSDGKSDGATEQRLLKQQQALQSLTKAPAFKQGKLTQALSLITQTAAEVLEAQRAGLWLLDKQHFVLADLYERAQKKHLYTIEWLLEKANYEPLWDHLQEQQALFSTQLSQEPLLKALLETPWLKGKEIAIALVGITLDESLVGFLSVEREKGHPWYPDEQTFLLALAEMASLAIEQGNRRTIEEELRQMLEENIAIEEELRQNLEELKTTNEEIQKAQLELQGQINAVNNAAIMFELDTQLNVTYINEAYLTLTGLTKEEILEKPFELLLERQHQEQVLQRLKETITKGHFWRGELIIRTKEGNRKWLTLGITPVLNAQQQIYKYIGVGFDITEQKLQAEQLAAALEIAQKQEQELRKQQEILEKANDELRKMQLELIGRMRALDNTAYLCEITPEGIITYVNEALVKVTHYTEQELKGKPFTMLRSGRQSEELYQTMMEFIKKDKVWKHELELRTKEGEFFWVIACVTPVVGSDGKPIKAIAVLTDISEQKFQEFRLQRQQEALLKLAKHPSIRSGNTEEAFKIIAEAGLKTLEADRVSIWVFEDKDKGARCMAVAQKIQHKHDEGIRIQKEDYPTYFQYLELERIIAVSDVAKDERTKELAEKLYEPSETVAVLDAAILVGAEIRGIISVEHHQYREWQLDEITFVNSLADVAGMVIEQKQLQVTEELRKAYEELDKLNKELLEQKKELEEKTEWMRQSLRYARRIQRNLLPDQATLKKYLGNYFVIHRQKDIVGGDFYWFHADGDLRIIVVADGTGHGVPGAFITMIGHMLFNQIVRERKIYRPADILYHLHIGVRKTLKQDVQEAKSRDGMDVAVCLYNAKTRVAQYAGANLPFYYYQDWKVHIIKPDKQSIGGEQMEEERVFTNHEIQLNIGDAIYMFTDGFVDQIGGPEGKRFGTKRFRELILRTQHESMATQRALLNLEWKEWKGDGEQLDDVTVFGMKIS